MPPRESEKPKVIEYLYARYINGEIENGLVTSDWVRRGIDATGAHLRTHNPANFLKDVIRSENVNTIWPRSLKLTRVSARQRYGHTRVFQFIPYATGQTEPFPDRFPPDSETNIHTIQSASMPFAARQLGRTEETWLTQIVVNLRLVESQLSIFSPEKSRLRDITHLQTGIKTAPEIDVAFLASYGETSKLSSATKLHMFISGEAKQIKQRLLEDQIREQVAKAMQITIKIKTPKIDAVKPVGIKVVNYDFDGKLERAIYMIEFAHILRDDYNDNWALQTDEQLYAMPLEAVSKTIYRIMPPVSGLNAT